MFIKNCQCLRLVILPNLVTCCDWPLVVGISICADQINALINLPKITSSHSICTYDLKSFTKWRLSRVSCQVFSFYISFKLQLYGAKKSLAACEFQFHGPTCGFGSVSISFKLNYIFSLSFSLSQWLSSGTSELLTLFASIWSAFTSNSLFC